MVFQFQNRPEGYMRHGNGIAMYEASEAAEAFSPTQLI